MRNRQVEVTLTAVPRTFSCRYRITKIKNAVVLRAPDQIKTVELRINDAVTEELAQELCDLYTVTVVN